MHSLFIKVTNAALRFYFPWCCTPFTSNAKSQASTQSFSPLSKGSWSTSVHHHHGLFALTIFSLLGKARQLAKPLAAHKRGGRHSHWILQWNVFSHRLFSVRSGREQRGCRSDTIGWIQSNIHIRQRARGIGHEIEQAPPYVYLGSCVGHATWLCVNNSLALG